MKICIIGCSCCREEVATIVGSIGEISPLAFLDLDKADIIFYFSPMDMRDAYPRSKKRTRKLILISFNDLHYSSRTGGNIMSINFSEPNVLDRITNCIVKEIQTTAT